jgi:excinuclease ABC subunit B
LVSILDADKKFLRSARSLIQTIGAPPAKPGECTCATGSPTRCARPSARPTAGAPSRSPPKPTASTQTAAQKIADISTRCTGRRDTDSVEVGGSGRNASRGRRAQGEPAEPLVQGVRGRDTSTCRAELADLIEDLTAQMMAATDLQFELAARSATRFMI